MGGSSSRQIEETLSHHLRHSRYFRRAKNFREGTELKVELFDNEPHIFELFIQFMDSAKAWVLGDYIDAPTFKRLALGGLCDIFLPSDEIQYPKSGFGPEAIDYCCRNSIAGSSLHQFYVAIAGSFWTHSKIVHFNDASWLSYELFGRLASHAGKKLDDEIPKMRTFALALEADKK
ncbi:hypothetical protein T440DRAFT_487920 [Plenodomus tracheiphilus IPT5]|uniref:BTB domain-containing protein n=1 Tax=Plenodomus tracheiphilus IPT5 TaxID=1408161 RepID=A0A6A7BEK1_9PLEO|nr:hypothetical protein T440DRAFT_487920 [Plenodomus tracheiphilus IPT5]